MSWLHNSPDLTIATIVLAALAALFGSHALAAKPSALPRQLLNAALAATLFGCAAFAYDQSIHLTFSTTLRNLLTIPPAVLPSSWPAALYFGILGFSLGLTPSVRSLVSVAQGQALPIGLRVATNAWALLLQSLTFILAAQVALTRLHAFPGLRAPLALVVVLAIVYVALRRLYRWWRYTILQRLRAELDALPQQSEDDAVTLPWVGKWGFRLTTMLLGALLFTIPLAVAGVLFWGYIVSLLGWSVVLFAVALLLVYAGLRGLHSWAARLPRAALIGVALALLAGAAGLQVYQALAG